jgi:hypothetical protein
MVTLQRASPWRSRLKSRPCIILSKISSSVCKRFLILTCLYLIVSFLRTSPVANTSQGLAQANNVLIAADLNVNDTYVCPSVSNQQHCKGETRLFRTQQSQISCKIFDKIATDNGDVPGQVCTVTSINNKQCLPIGANPGDTANFQDCSNSAEQNFSLVIRVSRG